MNNFEQKQFINFVAQLSRVCPITRRWSFASDVIEICKANKKIYKLCSISSLPDFQNSEKKSSLEKKWTKIMQRLNEIGSEYSVMFWATGIGDNMKKYEMFIHIFDDSSCRSDFVVPLKY